MYVILEILADSEYSEGGFKFCGIYQDFKDVYAALKPDQFYTWIDKNKTISDCIEPGIKVDDFDGDEKLTLKSKRYKVNDPQIIYARGGSLSEWRVHEFEYYYNLNGTIYEANYILLKGYDPDHHEYADHVILLDDIFDCDTKIESDDIVDKILDSSKPYKLELVHITYNNGNVNIECTDEEYKKFFTDTIVEYDLINSDLTTRITDGAEFNERFRNRMCYLRRNLKINFARSWIENDSLIYRCFCEL